MIARVWSARAAPDLAPAYAEHLRRQVLPAVRKLDGYAGALLLERPAPDGAEVLVITFWQSADAVRGFAGADVEAAVIAEEAAALLDQFDRRVRHYEVAVADGGPLTAGEPADRIGVK
jgi:heme-degrading monooxygenase HmoA